MRVFTAVDIENPQILGKLEEVQREVNYGFNKVKPDKMHLTLQFFKDVSEDELEEIKSGLENIELDPFKMKVEGTGVFPSKDYIRVVWAGVESEEIFDLKQQVSDHDVKEDNSHDFHPHITLARVKNIVRIDKKEFRRKLEELEKVDIGEVNIDSVKLFESIHNGDDTEYKILEEKKL